MTKTKFTLLFLTCLFIGKTAFCQDKRATLRVSVSPPYTWVKVGSKVIEPSDTVPQPYLVKLAPGMQQIELWADGFLPLTDSVLVKADGITDYQMALKNVDPEYRTYRKEKEVYYRKKTWRLSLISAGLLATSGAMYFALKNQKVDEYRSRAAEYSAGYAHAVTPADIQANKDNFQLFSQKFEDAQKKRNQHMAIGISAAVVTAGVTGWLMLRFAKHRLIRPKYPDKNPFVLLPVLEASPSGMASAGFLLRF